MPLGIMDNAKIGIGILILSILFLLFFVSYKIKYNELVELQMDLSGGSCIKEGQCIHDKDDLLSYLGIGLVAVTFSLGTYLLFFGRQQKIMEEKQEKIIQRLEVKNLEQEKDEKFSFLLKGLTEDEKKILSSIREQDGLLQSTLRIRTSMSKTKLSFVLKDLQEKGLIAKVPEGKKNKVYLREAL